MEKAKVTLIPKGMLKQIVLGVINEKPMHGYAIMNRIKDETGFWKPSPGTIYPVLKSMLSEGLIKEINSNEDSKRQYTITQKGKKTVKSVNSIRENMKNQVTNLYSEVFETDKKIVEKKIDEIYLQNPKLKKTIQTFAALMISTAKDGKKINQVIKIIEKTNKSIAKINKE
jgi:DNA-binding PadR family transcriptional regulator